MKKGKCFSYIKTTENLDRVSYVKEKWYAKIRGVINASCLFCKTSRAVWTSFVLCFVPPQRSQLLLCATTPTYLLTYSIIESNSKTLLLFMSSKLRVLPPVLPPNNTQNTQLNKKTGTDQF